MADPNNINVDSIYRTAEAERGKFWVVDDDYLSTLNYPTSGRGKYAVLTYQVNSSPITLSGDVQMGSVEISDADTDDRVNIAIDDTKNAMYVQSESLASEATLLSLSGTLDVTQTPDLVAASKIVQIGGIAETTTPNPVSDGDAVATWYDEYGRQILFGANLSVNAIDTNLINDSTLSRLGPVLNLDSIDKLTLGAGATVDVSNYHNFTVHIQASGITAGTITITVESSLDNVNWISIAEEIIADNDDVEISISQQAYRYLRTNAIAADASFDGAIDTLIYAGN